VQTQESESTFVQREVRVDAKPETVFAFFTDPALMVRWHGRLATLEPHPGGTYRVAINERAISRGEYREIVPYSRIVFSFGWEGEGHPIPPGSSTVEVHFIRDGDGTLVRLIHRDLPADAQADHAHGWEHYLPRLAIVAAGGDPGPDPMASGSMEERNHRASE
jgi:uncharacterized protein YndB with AHSA1/START domain